MTTVTYDRVRVEGNFSYGSILEMKMILKPNEHGRLFLRCFIDAAQGAEALTKEIYDSEIRVVELDESGGEIGVIFGGVIAEAAIAQENRQYILSLSALTGSRRLDEKKKSRSFQDVAMTYEDVVREVLSDTPHANAFFSVGEGEAIGRPLIQYRETDWAFIRRLASHFHSPVVPAVESGKPVLWFGMRQGREAGAVPPAHYHVGVDEKFYRLQKDNPGYFRWMFLYYSIEETGNYQLGDNVKTPEAALLVCEKEAEFKRGELIFSYKIGRKELAAENTYYNEIFTGLSIGGTVLRTDKETVHLHLDIDEGRQCPSYPYPWKPTSGNLMYCMPKAGTKAMLHFPDCDERKGIGTNSPRANGASCAATEEYRNRSFTTEHNKQLNLFPESMGLVGTGSPEKALQVLWQDKSCLRIESHRQIEIIAKESVELKAPKINVKAKKSIKLLRTAALLQDLGGSIVPKGTADAASWKQELTEKDGRFSYLSLEHEFQLKGKQGILVGTVFRDYPPFDDAPEGYDADKAWAQAILCVAGATVVFAACVVSGPAGLLVAAYAGTCVACAVVSEVAAAKLKHGELRPSDIRKIAVKASFRAVTAAVEVTPLGRGIQIATNIGCGFAETKINEGEISTVDIFAITMGGLSAKRADIKGTGISGGVRSYWKEHSGDEVFDVIGKVVDVSTSQEEKWK